MTRWGGAILVAAQVMTSAAAAPSQFDRWRPLIAEASQHFGMPAAWIGAVLRAESGGDARARSPKGAMGLMQIMPDTWAELRVRYDLGADAFDPHDNVLAGAAYLRVLYERYGYPNLFAAYNAGPGRFDEHLLHGRPLPAETQIYLARLGQPVFEAPKPASRAMLFFPLHSTPDAASVPLREAPNGLFVPLGGGADPRP